MISDVLIFFNKHKKNPSFLIFANLAFAGIYFFIANESLKLATINQNVSPVWPPTGVSILLLICLGIDFAPAIFIGALAANYFTASSPIFNSAIIAAGNTAEAVLGFWLYSKIFQYKNRLEHLTTPLAIGTSAIFAPMSSATAGVFSLYLFKVIPYEMISTAWLTWWIGDVVGALFLLPIGLSIRNGSLGEFINQIRIRNLKNDFIVVLSVLTIFASYFLLSDPQSLKYLFVFFPMILLFSVTGSSFFTYLCSLTLCGISLWTTSNGKGPFNLSQFNQNLINLEIFLSSVIITAMGITNFFNISIKNTFRFILMTGWIFWGVIFYNLQAEQQNSSDSEFQQITEDMNVKISTNLINYIDILRGGASLFMASENVTSEEWKAYVRRLNLSENHPGIQGLGVVFKVPDSQVTTFLKGSQKSVDPIFSIKKYPNWDESKKLTDHFIASYIEPYESNKNSLGLDLATDPIRKEAAEKAMLTGQPTITDRITLITDPHKRAGFLIFVPVYKKGLPISTESERKSNFSHWVYARFITEYFLKEALNHYNKSLILEVYEGQSFNLASQIYKSSDEAVNNHYRPKTAEINIGQKKFYFKWYRSQNYAASNDFLSTWIGLIGSLSVLVIACFILDLFLLQEKAHAIAKKLNDEFIISQNIIKQQESKIVESSKMAALGEMASSIAHEINNPLAIISAKAQQLEKMFKLSQSFEEKSKAFEHTTKIKDTIERIAKIIKGLRQFARDGEHDPMRSSSLEVIIEDTLSLCKEKFRSCGVDLKLNLEFRGEIHCRDTQISQVLLNLLNNSFDAINESKTKWIELSSTLTPEGVEITVTDSGLGIPKEIQSKILDPFFTTKEVGKGTGLGLSISKGIIESHKGVLRIDTNCVNTRFVILIPRIQSNSSIKKAA